MSQQPPERWPDLDQLKLAPPEGGARFNRALAAGWECVGPFLHRGPFGSLGRGPTVGIIPIRKPLSTGFSKSQRKLVARNRRRFRVEVTDGIDFERADPLYTAAKARFLGDSFDSLRDFASRYASGDGPRCFQIAIVDEGRLAAVSFLLVGRRAGYSLLGMFDPAYARYSLGTQTLLEEVCFLRRLRAVHYYPGHVLVGNDALDYKLRLSGLEYKHWQRGWEPLGPGWARDDHPLTALRARLAALAERCDFRPRQRAYPLFSVAGWVTSTQPLFDVPEFLELGALADGQCLVATVSLSADTWRLFRVGRAAPEPWNEGLEAVYGPVLYGVSLGPPLASEAALLDTARAVPGFTPYP